jgi:MFS superfamily sulfate permease-like transporter
MVYNQKRPSQQKTSMNTTNPGSNNTLRFDIVAGLTAAAVVLPKST